MRSTALMMRSPLTLRSTDSEPSLACPKSSWKQLPLPNQTIGAVAISDFTSCDCAQADGTPVADQCFADLDPENQTQVTLTLHGHPYTAANQHSASFHPVAHSVVFDAFCDV